MIARKTRSQVQHGYPREGVDESEREKTASNSRESQESVTGQGQAPPWLENEAEKTSRSSSESHRAWLAQKSAISAPYPIEPSLSDFNAVTFLYFSRKLFDDITIAGDSVADATTSCDAATPCSNA